MDANRPDWYVHHSNSYLQVDPESSVVDMPLFQQESSFILRTYSFYPSYYMLESLNLPYSYICFRDDGYLRMEPETYTTAYVDDSFAFYQPDSSRRYNNI